MSNGLSVIQDPLTFVGKLGQSFAASGMFGCKTPEQGHVLALHCVMEQQSPLTIMQTFHFIEGKLSMRADAMLGRANAAGFRHKVISRTAELATIHLEDSDGDGTEFSLSWADAQKEPFTRKKDGGLKDNWATPRVRMQMLWARVVSDAVRTMCPGIVCGAYTPEELDDSDPLPAGAIEGEIVQPASAPATAQAAEPAKRTRKPKEPAEPVASTQAAQAQTTADPVVEATATPVASDSSASQSIANAVQSANPAASTPAATVPTTPATQYPQAVIDIIQLRDYVDPRWPAESKHGNWAKLWPAVKNSLKMDSSVSDEEAIVKMPQALRDKLLQWLNAQRIVVDRLTGSNDLNTWANQNPTTSATQS